MGQRVGHRAFGWHASYMLQNRDLASAGSLCL